MKKSFLALALSGAMLFTSCEQEVVIDDAQLQSIVDAAVAAALANYPNTQQIADAAAAAATAAIASGLGDIDSAIQDALDAADALANPPLVRVGNGGIVEITEDTTWEYGNIYIMDGKVIVTDGATLTIEEGTIIKAADGQGANATVLVVAKGGKINAVGTADKPIIFTDVADEITYANGSTSPNRSANDRGKWGSVVLLGKAPTGFPTGEADIEGIVSGYDFTKFGGSDADDNSGVMKYVSIRHTGTAIGGGDELQGLTMGGVGSGTVIENIELIGSNDDGIEIFGGSVNVTNLVIVNHKDDGIDLDYAYSGTITNAVVFMASDSDTAMEIDGTESASDADFAYTLNNVTVYGSQFNEDAYLSDWKSGATGFNNNIVYVGFPEASIVKGIDKDTYDGAGTSSAVGKLNFKDIVFVGSDATTRTSLLNGTASHSKDEDGNTIPWTDAEKEAMTWLTVSTTKPANSGADLSSLSWSNIID